MGNAIDISGRVFGRLTVQTREPGGGDGKHTRWRCLCTCGNVKVIDSGALRSGRTASCGCLMLEALAAGRGIISHGHSRAGKRTAEYRIWAGMIQRCRNPNVKYYKNYGGRGINVCRRWLRFENFFSDMGPRPSSKHSIDRYPNKDGHYKPGNCRWATGKQQQRNKSTNRTLVINGRELTIAAWCEITGVKRSTYEYRVRHEWSAERAIVVPARGVP